MNTVNKSCAVLLLDVRDQEDRQRFEVDHYEKCKCLGDNSVIKNSQAKLQTNAESVKSLMQLGRSGTFQMQDNNQECLF